MPIIFRSTISWVIFGLIALAFVANFSGPPQGLSSKILYGSEQGIQPGKGTLIREGTSVTELIGTFRSISDRIVFSERSGGRTFRCLENLMLQRVYQVVGNEPNETSWIVAGQVTEFRGENFLLIEVLRRTK